jgi:hypothetical protein
MNANDFNVENHGSIFLVTPMNESARIWLRENTAEESMYYGGSLVVEHRYVEALIEGMREDGLRV